MKNHPSASVMADFVCGETREAVGNANHEADAHHQNCLSDNGLVLKTIWPFFIKVMRIIFQFLKHVLQS